MASGEPVEFVVQKCDTYLNDVVSAYTAPAHVLAFAHPASRLVSLMPSGVWQDKQ